MNGTAPIGPDSEADWIESSWRIRMATHADVAAVAAGVRDLLLELGGEPPALEALEHAACELIEDCDAGALLLADNEGEIVGVLGVSWQYALRVAGRYGLIQELWVHPAWRCNTIGGDLIVALFDLAREQGVTRLEVGLPSERFPYLAATEAFYVNCGFTTIGMRMRRSLW